MDVRTLGHTSLSAKMHPCNGPSCAPVTGLLFCNIVSAETKSDRNCHRQAQDNHQHVATSSTHKYKHYEKALI